MQVLRTYEALTKILNQTIKNKLYIRTKCQKRILFKLFAFAYDIYKKFLIILENI